MPRHRKKLRYTAPTAAVETLTPAAWSGFSGANYSPDRGIILWPDLDTRNELDSFSRSELMRRIRWLFANEGFIRGLIRNAATLVGYQTPQANSGDEEWDELAEDSFRDSCMTPEVFDHAGRFDFEDAQLMLKRSRYKDGDCFTVLTSWENGRAKFAFYEAHQLRSPENPPSTQKWQDGVLLGPGDRHLGYGFYDPNTQKVITVSARDVILSGEFDSPGNVRPIPPLAHAVNHAIDITEVWANLKKAIKTSSLFGAIREMDGTAPPRSRTGLAGPSSRTATETAGENVESSKVWNGSQIPRLTPGEKMKILADTRPHPNVREFVSDLIRDISTGFGLPPEVIWEMGRLTGPGVRFILDVSDRWIKNQQRIDKRWCRRVWVYYIAKEIKSGRLPLPKSQNGKKARWWGVGFTSQRNLTIDRGKESSSRIKEIEAGVATWAGWDDVDGNFWKDRTRQRVREVKFAQEECAAAGIDYATVFGRPNQPQLPATAPDPEEDPEEDEEEETTPPTP
jgi:capsid protein